MADRRADQSPPRPSCRSRTRWPNFPHWLRFSRHRPDLGREIYPCGSYHLCYAQRAVCSCRDDVCRVKDYRDHSLATLFGQVTVRLPRFLCAWCGRIETGLTWPSHCRSTPELDQLRAHLSALMSYEMAAELLEQMCPVDAGTDPETLRRHTLKAGAALAKGLSATGRFWTPAMANSRPLPWSSMPPLSWWSVSSDGLAADGCGLSHPGPHRHSPRPREAGGQPRAPCPSWPAMRY